MEGRLPNETLEQYAARLEKKLAAKRNVSFKVGDKGGVVVGGIRSRFPIMSPYPAEAKRIALEVYGMTEEDYEKSPIAKFIEANRSRLSFKNEED